MLSDCGPGEDSRVPWTARANKSILKEINPEYSLEGLMLTLKVQYFGWLIVKDPDVGKIEGKRRRGQQRMRWLNGMADSMDLSLSKLWEIVAVKGARSGEVHWVAKSWTQLSDWTEQEYMTSVIIKRCKDYKNILKRRRGWDIIIITKGHMF